MRTLQIYGTGSATANAVAQVIIPSATRIVGIVATLRCDSITDNASVQIELSKVATSEIAVNGAQDPFFTLGHYSNFVTSGLSNGGINGYWPLAVDCRQGEIIYLHTLVTNTSYFFTGILWFA